MSRQGTTGVIALVSMLVMGLVIAGTIGAHAQEGHDGRDAWLAVENVWARPGMMGGTSAVYMTLTNRSQEPLILKGAEAQVAGTVEIHETVLVTVDDAGGFPSQVMRMQQVPAVEIAPAGTVEFRPGGLHIMLLELQEALEAGDIFGLTLHFEGREPVRLSVEVRGQAAAPAHGHDHHRHDSHHHDAHGQDHHHDGHHDHDDDDHHHQPPDMEHHHRH